MNEQFSIFLQEAEEIFQNSAILLCIHEKLISKGCECEISQLKSGYMISYSTKDNKKVALIVTRKSGIKIRVYTDHIKEYEGILNDFPTTLKKELKKASICKRLVNPADCNPKCSMGYSYHLDGELMQKCRFSAFMPTINEKSEPFIQKILDNELAYLKD